MLDLHCHTELSFDSETKLEDYYNNHQIERFCQTEHYEFAPDNYTYDFNKVKSELKGIEIGYNKNNIDDINNMILEQKFDVVLLSYHKINQHSDGKKFDVEGYLHGLIEMFSKEINYTVFTHIDYPFRYRDVSIDQLIKNEQLLNECLQKFISTNKYLELNTSSIYKYKTEKLTKYIFEHYYKLGGRKISIGSDCHVVSEYNLKFDELLKYLEKYNDLEILNYII